MKNLKILNRGFTLIELLIVVAIIGILASVVLAFLNSARAKGDDAAVQSNLHTVANQAEIFYSDNGNSYLPLKGSKDFPLGVCKYDYSSIGSNMFTHDQVIASSLAEASKRSNGNNIYCSNFANRWAVAVGLKLKANTSWCIDSEGAAKKEDFNPDFAIDSLTLQCK